MYRIFREKDIKDTKIILDQEIEGKHTLYFFSMLNNLYNINETNDTFEVIPNLAAPVSVQIPQGFYDYETFRQSLKNQLLAIDPNFDVDFDETTGKYTITNPSSFTLTYDDSYKGFFKVIGLNQETIVSSSITSDHPANLISRPIFFIYFRDERKNNFQTESHVEGHLMISDGNTDFLNLIRVDTLNNPTQCVDFKRSRNIEIEFRDIDGNIIDTKNTDFILILRKNQN